MWRVTRSTTKHGDGVRARVPEDELRWQRAFLTHSGDAQQHLQNNNYYWSIIIDQPISEWWQVDHLIIRSAWAACACSVLLLRSFLIQRKQPSQTSPRVQNEIRWWNVSSLSGKHVLLPRNELKDSSGKRKAVAWAYALTLLQQLLARFLANCTKQNKTHNPCTPYLFSSLG